MIAPASSRKTLNGRLLNVAPDFPDLRDRIYEPSLLDLKLAIAPPSPSESPILDQGDERACTGFALAAAINLQNNLRQARLNAQTVFQQLPARVSPRMLYEMAKLHDDWCGEDYEGSSIRAALKGFYHNGVCDEKLAPYHAGQSNWYLTKEQAKNARAVGLGAYYRLRAEIIDYHAALNETGVIYASAQIHTGWQNPKHGIIRKSNRHEGGHAFIIVGYNENGFLIQNSWGQDWAGYQGHGGIAEWSYADWAENIMDAWVLRLGVPTPEHFDLTHLPSFKGRETPGRSSSAGAPRRCEILGHHIHIDDGRLVETGRYATPLKCLQETANVLKADGDKKHPEFRHLLFYMHGGLNSKYDSAKRTHHMKEVFKRNGIYPVHFMWETGFYEEMFDVLKRVFKKTEDRVGGWFPEWIEKAIDWSDQAIEKFARPSGRAIWREMKRGARSAFLHNAGGTKAIKLLLESNQQRRSPMKVHFVAHSAGSILLAEFLKAKNVIDRSTTIESVSLMAPACTIGLYEKAYGPKFGQSGGIKKMIQYNLTDQRELDDHVGPYRKSLLYFVSRAFEDRGDDLKEIPLLGMEKHCKSLPENKAHQILYAGRDERFTRSKTHGKFDNDRKTMNHILKTILGKKPANDAAFQEHELKGY